MTRLIIWGFQLILKVKQYLPASSCKLHQSIKFLYEAHAGKSAFVLSNKVDINQPPQLKRLVRYPKISDIVIRDI